MKLVAYEFHLGKEKAEKYVISLCKNLKLPINKPKQLLENITIGTDVINLKDEVNSVVRFGKAKLLQNLHDQNDRFLNSCLSLGFIEECGVKMSMTSNYGNWSANLNSSGLIESPELSLAEDLCFYQKKIITEFNNKNLAEFTRAYRGLLLASVSIIDCFINRHVYHIKTMIPSTKDYQNTATLDSRDSIESRLEAWMVTFATHKVEDFKKSKQRSKFIELKTQRNLIVHPSEPAITYKIEEVVKFTNYIQDGIGGLMSELRAYAGQTEYIGFIQQIKTMPKIRIIK